MNFRERYSKRRDESLSESLSDGQWDVALELWQMGMDTKDIAHGVGVHESVIYNGLPWRRKSFEDAA